MYKLFLLGQVKDELSEAESVVQECVEEKKKFSSVNNTELVRSEFNHEQKNFRSLVRKKMCLHTKLCREKVRL